MPAINRAVCRVHKHILGRQYLYVFRPETVLATLVNGDQGSAQAILTTTLDCTAALRGRTLLVGTAAGARDKGKIRIRANGDGAGNLYVSEHEITLQNGDHLTVLYDYELWHVDPFITNAGVIYKDCDDVTAPTAEGFPGGAIDDIYQPVPVMGPHSIQWLGEQHGFDWSRSWTISPNSGVLTFVDTFPLAATEVHDTPSTGHATWNTAVPVWAMLRLTDDMGGAPDVTAYDAHRLYVTLDPDWTDAEAQANGLYVDFRPSARLGTVDQGGFSIQFTVFVEASEADFPDGALVIWFFDGGTQEDIGGNWPHRTHIHFIGRITRASTHKEPETGMVVFDAVTIQQEMKSCPSFPNFMENEAAPAIWTEAHDLTVQRAAYLHMRWMTSLLEVADVLFVPTAPTAVGEHEFPEGDLYAQLNGLVNRDYLFRIGSDPLSTVYFNKDPQFQTPAVRAGIATIVTIEAQDWQGEIDLPEPILLDTSHVLASGNSYFGGTVNPWFSHAPGPVPLERGRRDKSLSRLICLSQAAPAPQTAINALSGLALAQANNDFPDIPIGMDGQYYVGHLFPMEFIELDVTGLPLPALTYPGGTVRGTKRNVNLSGEQFIPRRSGLRVVYDKDGAQAHALIDVNVEKVTYGVPGKTLVYPVEPPEPPGPDDGPPNGPWLPPTPPPPTPAACSALVASHSIDGVYWRPQTATDWSTRNTGLVSTAFLDLIWDPWWFTADRAGTSDPEHVILWGCGVGFVVRSGQDAGLSWTDVTPGTDPPNDWGDAIPPTASTVTYKQLHGDMHNLDTFYVLVEWQEAGGKWRGWIAKTTDDGVSWTWTSLSAFHYEGGYYYAHTADTFTGSANERHPWAACIGVGFGWGYENAELAVDFNTGTYGEFYRGWGFAQLGYSHWRMHFGMAFDRQANKIPVELKYKIACLNTASIPDESRMWPDENGGTWVAGATKYLFDGVDPVAWPLGGATVTRTVQLIDNDVTEWVGMRVGGFGNSSANCYLAYMRIHEDWAVGDPPQTRPLAMDLDTEDGSRLYVTVWRDDDVLYCQTRAAAGLGMTREYGFGGATEAQVAVKTYFIVPRCVHVLGAVDGDDIYVLGHWNDGADKHLAYSDDAAATFTNKGDAAWGAAHRVGALDVFYDGLTIYAFVNHAATPRLWETVDAGTNWANINSVPFNVEFDAQYRCQWADDEFVAGSNAAQAVMAARLKAPYAVAWTDVTDSLPAGAGAITAIIWV